jgi:hypothetical protein
MPRVKFQENSYIKNGMTVLVDTENLFVYEVSVFVYYKNYFSLINKKYFSAPNEINGVVGSFFKTPNIQICSELFSAPEQWLIDNEFLKYIKPQKNGKQKTLSNKSSDC